MAIVTRASRRPGGLGGVGGVGASGMPWAATAAVRWGVGVSYWFDRHFNLSLTATNALVAYSRFNGMSSTDVSVAFDPQVAMMVHLFD